MSNTANADRIESMEKAEEAWKFSRRPMVPTKPRRALPARLGDCKCGGPYLAAFERSAGRCTHCAMEAVRP